MPRKGRARRFREARQLKQGYDDGLFREGSGTLADVTDDEDEDLESDEYADEDDDDEDLEDEEDEGEEDAWAEPGR